MLQVSAGGVCVTFKEEELFFSFQKGQTVWSFCKESKPRLECDEGTFFFKDFRECSHEKYTSGVGCGIRSVFSGLNMAGHSVPYRFATQVWIEEASGNIFCQWIPLNEEGLHVRQVYWPGEMEFEEKRDSWYTLLNWQQGILLPNTWERELDKPPFDGMFETSGGYMPWYAQVKDRDGYIAICTTPWNAGWQAEHPAGGPYTHVGVRFEPSLGKMNYAREVRYTLLSDCDYNDICQVYRRFVMQQGKLRTLQEKAVQNPSVNDLIGCAFIHTGIKTKVQENSDFFDPKDPGKNDHLTTFATREQEICKLHDLGAKKIYMHLDGWAQPGYDNQHPDYYPICKEAGGREGMKSLVDTMHRFGYLFGVHDQYRDYYFAAEHFDKRYAIQNEDGTIPTHKRWAGGPQTYLCATQAPYYVRRNFSYLKKQGIDLDCAYLDVFTCNEGDECFDPYHKMTRRDCYEYRSLCFEYLLSEGILTSSEEVSDWAVPSLIMCHYAPYEFMMEKPGAKKRGIPVPLYNLVYHDCVIQPWMMDRVSNTEDYMLYALLNGGAPYLIRDGAYPNTDGSFAGGEELTLQEQLARCKVVCKLHEQVANVPLVRHELVDGKAEQQKSFFGDGTVVTVDFNKQTYSIEIGK